MFPPRVLPSYTAVRAGITQLLWPVAPRNIFLAKKDFDPRVLSSAREFVQMLHERYPVNLFVEPHIHRELELPFVHAISDPETLQRHVDLVVTMGGDGTILHAMSLFKRQSLAMPPVLSFSMGTLGFLLPFDFRDSAAAFEKMYHNEAFVTKRSRLRVTMPRSSGVLHALNEVTIHRGGSPHLAQLDIAVNDQHLTTAIADGVSVSTPTGSTAYSLSAGGSIVHPGVPSILLTPICPRSLSFRPLLVPQDAAISIRLAAHARGPSSLSLDGDENGVLDHGDTITMGVDPEESVWCVALGSDTDDWVKHINGLLGFNSKFGKAQDV